MKRFLQWENERFGDLQFLNQTENMNNGKSYEYFADLGRTWPSDDPMERPWDYAMKADDDSLINLPQLLERLRPMTPRLDTYVVSPLQVNNSRIGPRAQFLAYGSGIYIIMGFGDVVA
jgi:hypothetical protein